jgi:hypothetical protein
MTEADKIYAEASQSATLTSTQLSQQGIELYKRMLEDTVFIKRQQWATTNYAALIPNATLSTTTSQFQVQRFHLDGSVWFTRSISASKLARDSSESFGRNSSRRLMKTSAGLP